jgi:hypothetical protein
VHPLFHGFLIVLMVAVHFVVHGYGYSLPVHAEVLPILKVNRNPELYQNDWRVQHDRELSGTRGFYAYVHSQISRPFSLPAFELAFFLVTALAFLGGLYWLSWQLFADWRAAVLAIPLITLFHIQLGSHALFSRGPNITSNLAWAILIWGLVLFRRKPVAFGVLAGVATLVHVSIGASGMLVYGLAQVLPIHLDVAWFRRQVVMTLGYLLGAFPFVLTLSQIGDRSQEAAASDYATEILLVRIPWHVDHFRNYIPIVEWLFLIGIFFWISRKFTGPDHTWVRRFVSATVLLTVIELALNNPLLRVDTMVQLRPVRVALLTMVFAVLYLANALVKRLDELSVHALLMGIIPALAIGLYVLEPTLILRGRDLTGWYHHNIYLLLGGIVFLLGSQFWRSERQGTLAGRALVGAMLVILGVNFLVNRPAFVFDEAVQNPEDEMALWVRNNTEQDAVFIIPLLEERFQALSERAIVTDINNVPYPYFDEWFDRVFDILGVEVPPDADRTPYIDQLRGTNLWILGYATMDEDRARYLQAQYGASYLLIEESVELDFPVRHRCCGLTLYALDGE